MSNHNDEILLGYSDELRKSNRFLIKGVNTQHKIFTLLFLTLSIIVFGFILWLENQSSTYLVYGYLSLLLILIIIVSNMKKLVLAFRRYLSWVLGAIFPLKFKIPLFISLLKNQYSKSNDINSFLKSNHPLFLNALENAEGSLYDEKKSIIWPVDYYYFFRKISRIVRTKLQYINELDEHLPKLVGLVGEDTKFIIRDYCGEFSSLRDEKLLDFIEKLPEGLSCTITGFVGNSKVLLNDVLDEIAKYANKEERDPQRLITPTKIKRIKRIVKQKKLHLLVYGKRLQKLGIPHMAEIGNYITLQQFHVHGKPKTSFIFKTPSKELRECVKNFINQIEQSDFTKEVIYEE